MPLPPLGVFARPSVATSFESIATVTVGAGGASSVTFSSIPATTYTHLQVRALVRSNRSNAYDGMKMNFNSDTGNNYAWHYLYGDGTSATAAAGSTVGFIPLGDTAGDTATANVFGATIIDILDYKNTNKYKVSRTLGNYDNNGSGFIGLFSGLWQSTSAISTITIIPYTGTAFKQYSSFALFGIKGA